MATLNEALNVLFKLRRPTSKSNLFKTRTDYLCSIMQEAMDAMLRQQDRLNIPDRDIAVFGYLLRNPAAHIYADKNVCAAFDSAEKALIEDDKRRLAQCLQGT